ncbi:hypothetical protein [Rhizobium leguminosarum]|uniref:WYL domain-containing protein n=1 Tax=Rhizobium leguminosarum TaxID=384 RepID=A0A2K9ZFX8_RHILE|nr:hypothetical protein [Rhizobium leguminosarum]AUW47166.1 hypothetical protein CUJ84_pRLN3000024 [Rhizobium leguminosarum]
MSLDDLKYPQRQRLVFLDRCLTWRGMAKRRDLIDRFKISSAQAAIDFREYLTRVAVAPIYDATQKTYVAAPGHKPLAPSTLVEAFEALDGTGDGSTIASIPQPVRQATPATVTKLYAALKGQKAVNVAYTSINSGVDDGQWLVPTRFMSDGENVHLRAFSFKHHTYRDYLPIRISPWSTFELRDLEAPLPADVDWHTKAVFRLRPKSDLSDDQAAVVRREYGFDGEFLVVEIRKAMEIYFRRRWRLEEKNSRLEVAKIDFENL